MFVLKMIYLSIRALIVSRAELFLGNPRTDWQNLSRESSLGCTRYPVGATSSGV